MLDCRTCNNKGRYIVQVYTGMYKYIPCNCGHAAKVQQQAEKRRVEFKRKLEKSYRELEGVDQRNAESRQQRISGI